jgi:hypothetical protein
MRKFAFWIVLALVVRLVLIPVTLHPDFRAVNLAGYLIAQKGQLLSFYDYLSHQPRTDHWVNLYGDNLFIYPPPAYLIHALFNGLLFHLYPQSAFFTLLNDIGQLRLDPGFPLLMYLLKLPYLLADIGCFLLLKKLLPEKHLRAGLLFWLFNPVTIYSAYLVGQFDIFIALCVLLSVYFSSRKQILSPVMLGLGAGFKPFVLVLAPFLPGNVWKNSLIAVAAYGLTLLPYLGSPAFRQYALFASQSDKLLFAKIMISGSQFLPLFILGAVLAFWWRYFKPQSLTVIGWLSLPLLLFYSVTHFHPQWFTWIAPLLTLSFATHKSTRLPIIILIGLYLFTVMFFEPSLNFGLFGVNFSLFSFVNNFYSADQLVSVIRGLFASTAAYIILISRSSPHEASR